LEGCGKSTSKSTSSSESGTDSHTSSRNTGIDCSGDEEIMIILLEDLRLLWAGGVNCAERIAWVDGGVK